VRYSKLATPTAKFNLELQRTGHDLMMLFSVCAMQSVFWFVFDDDCNRNFFGGDETVTG